MVFRNTAANKRLAKRMELAVKQHPGFRPFINYSSNCGKDIRFEIGTVCALESPFTISTSCNDAGYFGIKVRMQKTSFNLEELYELNHWFKELESLSAVLKEYIAEAKPQKSYYAI